MPCIIPIFSNLFSYVMSRKHRLLLIFFSVMLLIFVNECSNWDQLVLREEQILKNPMQKKRKHEEVCFH